MKISCFEETLMQRRCGSETQSYILYYLLIMWDIIFAIFATLKSREKRVPRNLSLVSIWSPRSHGSSRSLETVYRRSKRLYGNSDGKLRDDRGDRDDRDRPDRTLLYPGDRDDRVKFTCDHMETVNRPDRLHNISSDWGDRGDYMETRLKRSNRDCVLNYFSQLSENCSKDGKWRRRVTKTSEELIS